MNRLVICFAVTVSLVTLTACNSKEDTVKRLDTNIDSVVLSSQMVCNRNGFTVIDDCILSGNTTEDMLFTSDYGNIGPECFKGDSVIKTLTIDNIRVGVSAFEGSSVNKLVITGDNVVLEDNAFAKCSMLESVTVSGCLGFGVFAGCSSLKDVKITEGVKTVYNGTFSNCGVIECVEIPSTMINLTSEAFEGTTVKKIVGYSNTVAEYLADELNSEFVSLGDVE